jgi:asparagine synthase (glutamine-hydrolysing)
MCGIWAYCGGDSHVSIEDPTIQASFMELRARGPESTETYQDRHVILGFHRLKINDLSDNGNQPMVHPNDDSLVLICNGEIYNHEQIKKDRQFQPRSTSDCETILHLYQSLRHLPNDTLMNTLCNQLDAEFAFILYDKSKNLVFVARDPYGVRPLFIGFTSADVQAFVFASELKGLHDMVTSVDQFRPGNYMVVDVGSATPHISEYTCYRHFCPRSYINETEQTIQRTIQSLLEKAVNKRVNTNDRKVCALLSGGLDSSLVAALAARQFPPYTFETFSIGIKGSTDIKYSKVVAEHIKSKHTVIELSEEEFLGAIEETIRIIESYDTTTVRASIGNYLVAKYISTHTDNKVVLNGDYSDEVCGGYIYMKKCTDAYEFSDECWRLVDSIHYFDSLRSDRTICSQGLEARTPFSDKAFVEYYLSIPPELRMSHTRIEKYLLRKAFDTVSDPLLPPEVLWRHKEAFSDGVSNPDNSFHTIIQRFIDTHIDIQQLNEKKEHYIINKPMLNETLYYRSLFHKYYKFDTVIPYYWLPRFCGNIHDPSAREITDIYVT